MTRDDVIAKVAEIWGHACKTFRIKNTTMPEVTFFSRSGVAGKAWYGLNKVEFNEILAMENSDTFETTIGHEIAHLVTNQLYPNAKQHHGPEFKHVMQTLGYDPRTYHSYDTASVSTKRVKTRFHWECVSCGDPYEIAPPTHKKMLAIGGYFCSCGAPVFFTGKETKFV